MVRIQVRQTLPIVWSEFYPGLKSATGKAKGREAVAVDMSNIIQARCIAGVNYMLIWICKEPAGTKPMDG